MALSMSTHVEAVCVHTRWQLAAIYVPAIFTGLSLTPLLACAAASAAIPRAPGSRISSGCPGAGADEETHFNIRLLNQPCTVVD